MSTREGPGAGPPAPDVGPRPAPAEQPPESARSITRVDLEMVIRRAAELSLAEADAQERLSEQDLVRIAEELGLPARHVWQALYERPSMSAPEILGERWLGSPIIVASRVLPGDLVLTRRRLEDYLATQEYLTVARRTTEELRLVPADDAITTVARAFSRPRRRHHLAHARRVIVGTHPLPNGEAAVRIEMDLEEQRRKQRQQAVVQGGLVGALGFGAGMALSEAIVPGSATGLAGLASAVAISMPAAYATFAAVARGFRTKAAEARLELDSLLDRLETGERLEPPHAPWRRRLGLRLFGTR